MNFSFGGGKGFKIGFGDKKKNLDFFTPTQYERNDNPVSAKDHAEKQMSHEISNNMKVTFDKIKDQYRRTKIPWEDPDFPATIESVYPKQPTRRIQWKRPHELTGKPLFTDESASRFDIVQGELGDCWVLAALASLSMHSDLFNKVVPPNQNFEWDYCGAFLFRFWIFGKWEEVLVDDRLPTEHNRLIFMHSKNSSEFWSALIEKAYAKINGCYEALIGGSQAEAMEDFTGGLCETIDLSDQIKTENLFKNLVKYATMNTLIGCSIDATSDQIENELPNGLIIGHAYSLTNAKQIDSDGELVNLVRIRNPWGDSSEWKGAYSDNSVEWKIMNSSNRNDLGLVFDHDGEFWMTFEDFMANFSRIEICHLGPGSIESTNIKTSQQNTKWEMTLENSTWTKNVNAGGCRNFIDSFASNPQFVINIKDPDPTDEENMGSIIVGLMQKDMRKRRLNFWTIGYAIYKFPPNTTGLLDKKYFRSNKMAGKSDTFIDTREIVCRHRLEPGKYVIVPSTFNPNEDASFILRVFCQTEILSGEMTDKTDERDPKLILNSTQKEEESIIINELEIAYNETSGPKGLISAIQIKILLDATLGRNIPGFEGFNIEVCRSLLALKDFDYSGAMDFKEFSAMWLDFRIWRKIFTTFDETKSGHFSSFNLKPALKACGFTLDNTLYQALINRYTDTESGKIHLDDFILMVCRLKNAFFTFKAQPKDQEGRAVFSENSFLINSLYM